MFIFLLAVQLSVAICTCTLGKAFLQNRSFQADAIGPKAGVRKVQSQTTLLERKMFDMNVVIPPTSPVPVLLMID